MSDTYELLSAHRAKPRLTACLNVAWVFAALFTRLVCNKQGMTRSEQLSERATNLRATKSPPCETKAYAMFKSSVVLRRLVYYVSVQKTCNIYEILIDHDSKPRHASSLNVFFVALLTRLVGNKVYYGLSNNFYKQRSGVLIQGLSPCKHVTWVLRCQCFIYCNIQGLGNNIYKQSSTYPLIVCAKTHLLRLYFA